MRIKEERKVEKEWRRQEIREVRREENRRRAMSRSLTVDWFIFIFSLLFDFSFSFIFYFLFLEQLRLGLSVTLSHQSQIDGIVTKLITGLGRMK